MSDTFPMHRQWNFDVRVTNRYAAAEVFRLEKKTVIV
jgi:hypothetical protein